MPSVTYDQVAVSLGRPISDAAEQGQVTQWISDAETLIRMKLGDLAALDADALAYVVRESVILKIRNPEGKQAEGIDDYNYRRYDANARGQVVILAEWWDLLTPDTSSDAYTITPYSAPGYAVSPLDGWA